MVIKIHKLKIWKEYFEVVSSGYKTFELRKNDRDYKKGDILILEEWDPEKEVYTNRTIEGEVIYILNGPSFGLLEGYCIMSLKLPKINKKVRISND